MSKKDAVLLASRALALLLTVWALSDVSSMPEQVHSFLHYLRQEPTSSPGVDYLRHYYLIRLCFLVTRIVGFSLMARWLFKGGPEVEELFLPSQPDENAAQD